MAVGVLIAIGVILVIIDMMVGTFVTLLLGIAIILSAFILFITNSFWITFLSFLVFSFVLWLSTQKFGRRVQGSETLENGVYALIGKEVKVHTVSAEESSKGTCQVYGEEWSVKADGPMTLGERVIITQVKGATLYVKHKNRGDDV